MRKVKQIPDSVFRVPGVNLDKSIGCYLLGLIPFISSRSLSDPAMLIITIILTDEIFRTPATARIVLSMDDEAPLHRSEALIED